MNKVLWSFLFCCGFCVPPNDHFEVQVSGWTISSLETIKTFYVMVRSRFNCASTKEWRPVERGLQKTTWWLTLICLSTCVQKTLRSNKQKERKVGRSGLCTTQWTSGWRRAQPDSTSPDHFFVVARSGATWFLLEFWNSPTKLYSWLL